MKFPLLVRSVLALAVLALLVSAFQQPAAEPQLSGAITTLYAGDPLEYTLNLLTGKPGLVERNGAVGSEHPHLIIGREPDRLTSGIETGQTAAIVDLGTAQEAAKGSSTKPVGNCSNVFLALAPAWIRKHAGLKKTEIAAEAAIKPGHIYLVRIASEGQPDILAKLLVLEFRPGESVTFRWQRIEG